MRRVFWIVFLLCPTPLAHAQFELEESHTTASLRGIHSLGDGVAWASGANGVVLRTEDGGYLWQPCSVPNGAETLDFRGVQGFNANTAVVMASGKGELSKIYKTIDGCQTWKLVFTNPDTNGFFDAIQKVTRKQMYVLGDPVGGKFAMFYSPDAGDTWFIADDPGLEAQTGDGAFAASNSSLVALQSTLYFGTGGGSAAHVYSTYGKCVSGADPNAQCPMAWAKSDVPVAAETPASGVFALAARTILSMSGKMSGVLLAVGGAYDKPEKTAGTSATSVDGGKHWVPAVTMPHGYRSAIAFDLPSRSWIAVGPNGTDVSNDDGKNWIPLRPGIVDGPGSDAGWNAVSLPFVVGVKGRIGKLRGGILTK